MPAKCQEAVALRRYVSAATMAERTLAIAEIPFIDSCRVPGALTRPALLIAQTIERIDGIATEPATSPKTISACAICASLAIGRLLAISAVRTHPRKTITILRSAC